MDPHFLSDANPFVTELVQAARRVNERMPHRIVRRICELVEPARGRKVALLGAAYKADVDDARESPTVHIDALLRDRGFSTSVYDPHVKQFERPLCRTLAEAVTDADALVLVTAHSAFRSIRPAEMVALMRTPRLVDTSNFFEATNWKIAGSRAISSAARYGASPRARLHERTAPYRTGISGQQLVASARLVRQLLGRTRHTALLHRVESRRWSLRRRFRRRPA